MVVYDKNSVVRECSEIIDNVYDCIMKFTFDKDYSPHQMGIVLLCRIVDIGTSGFYLIEKDIFSSFPIILRAMLEANIDLDNVHRDGKYINNMLLNANKEKLKFLDSCIKVGKVKVDELNSIKDKQKELKNEIDNLEKMGARSVKPWGKFELALRQYDYHVMYGLLCSSTHNNPNELQELYFEIENDKVKNIVLFKDVEPELKLMYVDGLLRILVYSLNISSEITDNKLECVEQINDRFNSFYETYRQYLE